MPCADITVPLVRPVCVDQVLCTHAAAAAFASATRFEAPRFAAQSADGSRGGTTYIGSQRSSVITSAAVAAQVLLMAQGRKFSAFVVRPDKKKEPTWDRTAEKITSGVVVKSESSGRKESNRHSLNGAAANVPPINENRVSPYKVLPIHEDRESSYAQDRSSTFSLPPEEEWTIDSVSEIEQQEASW